MRYFLPFSYFLQTRLLKNSLTFHLVFEWIAAAVLVVSWGRFGVWQSLFWALASYFAFISIYEIGYMVNDLFAARKEKDGRLRGPQDATNTVISVWIVTRIGVFLALTFMLDNLTDLRWWTFFAALSIIFAVHNRLTDKEKKVATFLWLGWFRFMAPMIFVLQETQIMGIAFAAAITYVAFRNLGYMDSKGFLTMVGRKRPEFQRFFFASALSGVLALLPYPQAHGAINLLLYFALVAAVGTLRRNDDATPN